MIRQIFIAITTCTTLVSAHFQVIYTPETVTESQTIPVSFFFTHPYDGNTILATGRDSSLVPQGLRGAYLFHNDAKTELTNKLKSITFSSEHDTANGYSLSLGNKEGFRSGGTYALMVDPHPYWEPKEDLYIQQFTKLLLNRGGMGGTEWAERFSDNYTEIIPLVNPFTLTKGALFRGKVVDNNGDPVSGVHVEIEYLNYAVDQQNNFYGGTPYTTDERRGIATMITDANGIFAFIPPFEGYWGFAALEAGNVHEYNGKGLEQSPVLWIHVAE